MPSSPEDDGLIARNVYGTYSIPIDAAQRPAARVTLDGGVWEKSTIDFMRRHVGNKDIVHAGAFFGDFFPGLSAALHASARIWAFEPNPDNYRHAVRTIELNRLTNVYLQMAGVGNETASRKLRVKGRTASTLGGASRFVEYDLPVGQEALLDANVIKIDDAVPSDRDVGIIQLDLEGYELKALFGASETIRRCKPIIIFEKNLGVNECVKFLSLLGYQNAAELGPNLVMTTEPKGSAIHSSESSNETMPANSPTAPLNSFAGLDRKSIKMVDDVFHVLRPASSDRQKTIVVLGAPRGGTSMVAATLRSLGVMMGEKLGNQHEDPRFRRDIPIASMMQTILDRNTAHDVWGWKLPNTVYYVEKLLPYLRNPHFVAIFRNPYAISHSSAQRDERAYDVRLLKAAANHTKLVVDLIGRTNAPTALISFEAAIQQPERFVRSLAGFIGVPADNSKVHEVVGVAINRALGYVNLPENLPATPKSVGHMAERPISTQRVSTVAKFFARVRSRADTAPKSR